jgi:uncharacterized protein with beta-barrel porin domain
MGLFSTNYKALIKRPVPESQALRFRTSVSHRILVLLLGATVTGAAAGAAEIDSDTTTPVATSTADSGSPGDITVTDDGEIDVSGSGDTDIVTVDSDNDVLIEGDLLAEDTDGVTGIHVTTGRETNLTVEGSIQLIEDYDREDEDDDDDLDGPLAIGSDRIAILVDDGDTLTGDIVIGDSGYILVEGNDSAGVIVNPLLDGNYTSGGAMSVVGDNAVGVQLAGGVTGDVTITGSISTRGENAAGVEIGGDIGGTFALDGTITSTGFTSTAQTNYVAPLYVDDDTEAVEDRLDADDLYDNAFAVRLTGSVDGGVLINGAVDDFISEEDEDDETKDTVEDFDENRGTGRIYSYGSGIALDIEAVGSDITLGPVVETVRDTLDDDDDDDTDEILATFTYDQGLINRGTIMANGLNIGFDATALAIHGAEDGSTSVTVEGGVLNTGIIRATAYEADALAFNVGISTDIGTFENTGTVSAVTYTLSDDTATALQIDSGANLETVVNSGTISAASNGYGGIATAILDNSGTLTRIENTGTISGTLVSDGREDLENGIARAIDLSATTVGITLIQDRAVPTDDTNSDDEIDEDDVADPYIVGDILFGSGDDVFRVLDGYVYGDTYFGDGASTLDFSSAIISGDLHFGSDIEASLSDTTMAGDFYFGSASGTASISNESTIVGSFFAEGGNLALAIADSDVTFSEETDLELASLTVSGASVISLEVDPNNIRTTPFFQVSGTAVFTDELSIQPVLTSLIADDFSVPLLTALSLDFSADYDTVTTELPWIYDVSLVSPEDDANALNLDFHLKSAEELSLDSNQSNAYAAVLQVATGDEDIGAAVAELTTEKDFLQAYDLLLPQRTDAATRYLESQASAAFGSLGAHLEMNRASSEAGNGAWIQENFSTIDASGTEDSPGYDGRGLGISLGYDRPLFGLDAVGIMGNMSDGRFEEKTGGLNPVTMKSFGIGLYASDKIGPVTLQAAGLYSDIGHSSYRRVVISEYESEVSGEWDGRSTSASILATSDIGSGAFQMSPRIGVDYFSLDQDGYQETASNGLNLAVSDAHTEKVTASTGVALSWTWRPRKSGRTYGPALTQFDSDKSVEPMLRTSLDLGYRSTLSSTPYETQASFVGYDETFTLRSSEEFGDAATVGLSMVAGSQYLKLHLGVGGEFSDEATVATANASIKLRF